MFKLINVVLILLLMASCANSDAYMLQEFKMNNRDLDSLAQLYTNELFKSNEKNEYYEKAYALLLIIEKVDSNGVSMTFKLYGRSEVSGFIFNYNYRVLGYCNNGYKEDLLVLDGSGLKYNDLSPVYKLILPEDHFKKFDYVFLPKMKYEYSQQTDSTYLSGFIPTGEFVKIGYVYSDGRIKEDN